SPTAGTARSPSPAPFRSWMIRLRRSRSCAILLARRSELGESRRQESIVKYTHDRSPHRKNAYTCTSIHTSPRQESRNPGKYNGNLKEYHRHCQKVAGNTPAAHFPSFDVECVADSSARRGTT